MIVARVEGRLVSSEKHPSYEGAKILWVQPLGGRGEPRGAPLLALDTVGAGAGETVLVTREGGASILAYRQPYTPLDSAVVAIVDELPSSP